MGVVIVTLILLGACSGPEGSGAPSDSAPRGEGAQPESDSTRRQASGDDGSEEAAGPPEFPFEVVVLDEVYETPRDTVDDVDSPAVWHGPDGQHWILATAKATDVLRLSDAGTGELLRRIGGSGLEPGRFERPNGIAVVDDLVIVVERDNHRVQVLRLPGFEPLGTFGRDRLRRPYGVAAQPEGEATYRLYVTDNWEIEEDVIPPDSLLGNRVHDFRIRIDPDGLSAEHVAAFGETVGPGILHVVESIAVDPDHGRLLIAEEQEGDSGILVYDRDGRFTGRSIGSPFFPTEAEGIVLYACDRGEGYWVATDQHDDLSTFHVFDRDDLEHRGSFTGRTVKNTDGIAVTQRAFGGFPAGAFFAVHDDGSTVAFRWDHIAQALGLRADCMRP